MFAGEWVAEWEVNGETKEEYQKFVEAQLHIYGHATFGWAYWTLKNVNNHLSLEWMIRMAISNFFFFFLFFYFFFFGGKPTLK